MVNTLNILDELQEFLRSSDIFSISTRGVTTATETFDGDGSTVTFTLSNSGLKNIRSVTISAASQTKYVDYTINYSTPSITFTTAPASGTDNISITYDYSGVGDRIYSDFPRPDVKLSNYPRLGFDIVSDNIVEHALNGQLFRHNVLITFIVYGTSKNEVETAISSLRTAIINNSKSFVYLNYLKPIGISRTEYLEGSNNEIIYRSCDFNAPVEFEY